MTLDSRIGKIINERYQITTLLGKGGMSAVYKATDPNLHREVAIKLIHAHLSDNPEFVRRFDEEAGLLPACAIPTSSRFMILTTRVKFTISYLNLFLMKRCSQG